MDENNLEETETQVPEQFPTNPRVGTAKSHHEATASMPGGDKYTDFTKWRRRILGIVGVLILVYICYMIAAKINVGSMLIAPNGPSVEVATADLQKAAPPDYNELKYLSNTTGENPTVDNVKVGRVVSGSDGSSYQCEATGFVTFSNSSITSTSKYRIEYTYNGLLNSWSASKTEIEYSNYSPNGAPDEAKIDEDALALLSAYDEDAGTEMADASISSSASLSAEGGEMQVTFTKAGAGKYGANLTKTMYLRIKWSDVSGWVAAVERVRTENADLDSSVTEKASTAAQSASLELTVNNGDYVSLTGTVSGNTLTTSTTAYTIGGQTITTSTVTLSGNYSGYEGSTVTMTGNIYASGNSVSLTVQ